MGPAHKRKGQKMDTIEKAKMAVETAVKPYGFAVTHTDDTCLKDGELWFILSDGEISPAFFEAIFYVGKPRFVNKREGDIAFGIMDGEWSDLPDNPAEAVERFKKYRYAKSLMEEAKN